MAELEHTLEPYCQDMELLKSNKIWTTRDGDEIPVKNMTKQHLINTVNMLKRNNSDREWIKVLEDELKSRQ